MHNNEWWFVVQDIIEALTGSTNPLVYIKAMRRRDPELRKGWVQIVSPLLIETAGGKQKLNCSNTEGIFRIIQSVPSPKAEPFKLWLAQVGYERIKEIENPELASQRAREIYKAKGYSRAWIEKRMRGIQVREELTDEWKQRGVNEPKQFGILTAEICRATFGVTPSEYKQLKDLKKENLRDHMTDLELIFTMLGEASTTNIARGRDAQGFDENKDAANAGGTIAGNARKELEKKSGDRVVTNENYLEASTIKLKQTDKV
jgi:DNA-damage-inducible protein D